MPAADAASLVLGDAPDAVRVGRRFVQAQVAAAGAGALADDASLVASELLANASQHGLPPVVLRVAATPDVVRLEVQDASPRSPVRTPPSGGNLTGRGLLLVDRLSARWGVRPGPAAGKTVWSELVPSAAQEQLPGRGEDLDELLAAWDEAPRAAAERYVVTLGDLPTDLLLEAKAHIDNLVREFSLAATGSVASGAPVSEELARLIEAVVHGFSDARAAIKRQAVAAASRREPRTSLTLRLPLSAADAGEAYLEALDKADAHARAARLLTLAAPPEHRVFRNWYVGEVVDQLRRAARGEPPGTAMPFEHRLLHEVRRLSVAERAGDRARRLQRVTAALARARTPEDVAAVVVRQAVEALEASGGVLLVPSADGAHLAVPGAVGYGPELVDRLRAEEVSAPLPAATALRTGEPVWLESRQECDERFPALHGMEERTEAMCAVPLDVGDRRLGALRFSFDRPRLFGEDEREFVLALAAQTAQTLLRSELYWAERTAAVQLHRALLPSSVPAVPGWDTAAHYSPAGAQEVGGDWFDCIALPGGRLVAVVGDVMGRGVAAAAAMAQVRSAVRALACVDPAPATVLSGLDRMFETLELEQLVTVLYLLADARTERVRLASAGHLPPLLFLPGGRGRRLPVEPQLPLGVATELRTACSVSLPHGSALACFTDGLVERRGVDIDAGVDRLAESVRLGPHGTAAGLVADAVAAAGPEGYDDDVTVLALRRVG